MQTHTLPRMQTHTLRSGGATIHVDLLEPAPSATGSRTVPALLLLHGAGGNVSFWLERLSPSLARLGIALYAVHYFDRTATTRATPAMLADGQHVPLWAATIRDTLAWIRLRPGIDPDRIALLGISLGAFLALGLGAQAHSPADPIRAIVEISGGLVPPFESSASTRFPPTLIVHGDADSIVPASHAHALASTLTRLHVPHQVEILPGEGHWFSPPAQARILGAAALFLGRHLGFVE